MNKWAPRADRFPGLRKRQRGRRGEDESLGVGRSAFVVVLCEGDDLIRVGVTDRRVVIGEGEHLLLLKASLVGYRHLTDVAKKAPPVGAHDRKVSKVAHLTARLKGGWPAPAQFHPVLDRRRAEIEYALGPRGLRRDRWRFHPASDPRRRGRECEEREHGPDGEAARHRSSSLIRF